jgi:hypothetical protein
VEKGLEAGVLAGLRVLHDGEDGAKDGRPVQEPPVGLPIPETFEVSKFEVGYRSEGFREGRPQLVLHVRIGDDDCDRPPRALLPSVHGQIQRLLC